MSRTLVALLALIGFGALGASVGPQALGLASSADAGKVRPQAGGWTGSADPGYIHFHVRRRDEQRDRVITSMRVIGKGVCANGRTVAYDFQRPKDGVFSIFPNGHFGVTYGGHGEAQNIQGEIRFYVSVFGRFTSRSRAKGDFDVTIWTTDPAWGNCQSAATDGTRSVDWHATHD